MNDIDSHCEKHKPDIIVIDQLDKVNVSGTYARTDEKLRAVYTGAREIAKRHNCCVIAISQASADAHGKTRISFDMMENSKTGKAAEADLIIGIGGGITGDLTGFVASIYKRGINFISVPTTLLSQVDAAVGGKTGVNSNYGKNLIGSYYQPSLVICDLSFLNSLPKRQVTNGYAEILKHAIISDKNSSE